MLGAGITCSIIYVAATSYMVDIYKYKKERAKLGVIKIQQNIDTSYMDNSNDSLLAT